MLNAKALTSQDLQALSHGAISELAANLLTQLRAKDAQTPGLQLAQTILTEHIDEPGVSPARTPVQVGRHA